MGKGLDRQFASVYDCYRLPIRRNCLVWKFVLCYAAVHGRATKTTAFTIRLPRTLSTGYPPARRALEARSFPGHPGGPERIHARRIDRSRQYPRFRAAAAAIAARSQTQTARVGN